MLQWCEISSLRRFRNLCVLWIISAFANVKAAVCQIFDHFQHTLCKLTKRSPVDCNIDGKGVLQETTTARFRYNKAIFSAIMMTSSNGTIFWPFVRGIHRSPVNSLHKGQRRGALMFSFTCSWLNGWVNNRAGDLKLHRAHYDAIVMNILTMSTLKVAKSVKHWSQLMKSLVIIISV